MHQAELLRLPFPAPEDMPDRERSRSAADALATFIERQVRQAGQTFGRQPSEHEVLKEIDSLAYDFFCLSKEERILVEDTVEHTIPAVQPNRGNSPAIWWPATPSDRRAYARTLADNLAQWFDGDCSIETQLVAHNDDLAVLRLRLRDSPVAFDYTEDDELSLGEALSGLTQHIHHQLPGNLQSLPNFRVFVDRDLFLVKPLKKRFWLRSIALADANAIALDLHGVVGRRHDVRPGRA